MSNGYNLDFYTKAVFEKEIERLKTNGYSNEHRDHLHIIQYMAERIQEIDKEYEEPIGKHSQTQNRTLF